MDGLIAAQDIRDYANFPNEVPERLIETHIAHMRRDLSREIGQGLNAEIEQNDEIKPLLKDALLYLTLASLLPQLHTFALDGAAKVGRLEGSVEFRFLTPDDVRSYVEGYQRKAQHITRQIKAMMARSKGNGGANSQPMPAFIIGSL